MIESRTWNLPVLCKLLLIGAVVFDLLNDNWVAR